MADCECLVGCPFFNDKMANMPSTAEAIKRAYCRTNNLECARYMVFSSLGKEKVPKDLFPQDKDEALMILRRVNDSTNQGKLEEKESCEYWPACEAFFARSMGNMPATANIIKKNYCNNPKNHKDCARYLAAVKLGRNNIPEKLFPNQKAHVNEI